MPKRHSLDPKSLKLVARVAESEGFAAAARQIGISQPALSRTIRSLEVRLGYDLFERDVRGARPTEAAKVLIDGVRPAFKAIDDAVDRSRRVAEGKAGGLRFGLMETVSWSGLIPAIIRCFRAQFPDVELDAVPLHSTEQLDAINAGRLDIGSIYYRPPEPHAFQFMPLLHDPIALCVNRDSALATLPEPVALSELATSTLVWFERYQSPAYHDQMLAALQAADASPVTLRIAPSTSTMLALVAIGFGYTFMPASSKDRKPPNVLFKAINRPDLSQSLVLAWKVERSNPAIDRFVDCALQVLATTEKS